MLLSLSFWVNLTFRCWGLITIFNSGLWEGKKTEKNLRKKKKLPFNHFLSCIWEKRNKIFKVSFHFLSFPWIFRGEINCEAVFITMENWFPFSYFINQIEKMWEKYTFLIFSFSHNPNKPYIFVLSMGFIKMTVKLRILLIQFSKNDKLNERDLMPNQISLILNSIGFYERCHYNHEDFWDFGIKLKLYVISCGKAILRLY